MRLWATLFGAKAAESRSLNGFRYTAFEKAFGPSATVKNPLHKIVDASSLRSCEAELQQHNIVIGLHSWQRWCISAHDLDYHLFADDSQLYVFVKPVQANVDGAIGRLEKCSHDIRTWMRSNFLKLNDGKTEVLLIGSRQQLSKIALPGVTVGESLIAPATTVRDLGAVFDMPHMTMVPHVNTLAQSARYHIRNSGTIRRFLDRDTCEKIVHAFVTVRLDLNNALLAGLPDDTCGHPYTHQGSY